MLSNLAKHQIFDEKENIEISCENKPTNLVKNQPVADHIKNQKTCEPKLPKYLPLPVRPKKKKYTNRVGEYASIMRKQYKVHVDLSNIAEDTSKDAKEPKENPASNKRKITQHTDNCKKNNKKLKRPLVPTSINDDITITNVTTCLPIKRIKRDIDNKELELINNEKMLTDTSINCAQNILHEAFPNVAGLEDTTLGPKLNFSVHKEKFVQILHTGSLHWLCVSNYGCKKGEINYYDSLYCGVIANHVQKQIAKMLQEDSDRLTVHVKPVQQQTNTVDCGVFAIAFSTHLLHGKDPSKMQLNPSQMRHHLAICLQNSTMSLFPENNETEGNMSGTVRTPPDYFLTPPEWFGTPPQIFFPTPPPPPAHSKIILKAKIEASRIYFKQFKNSSIYP